MEDLKQLMEALQREIALLKELVKAKDDLIMAMKFQPAPIIIRDQAPLMVPYMQTIPIPQFPMPQPPFTVTCDNTKCPDSLIGTQLGQKVEVLGQSDVIINPLTGHCVGTRRPIGESAEQTIASTLLSIQNFRKSKA
jgi:hypothetical protein